MGEVVFLQNMREKTQSWVAYIIVSLLILSFALWGISSYFSAGQEKGPIATVGSEDISYANFSSAYRTFLQGSQLDSAHLTPDQSKYAQNMVLKGLIERLSIQQYITKIGFAVNQHQIDAALMSVPLFSDNGEFSPALFKRFLMANNITAQQFLADFATRMTMAQWGEGIKITSFSTPEELSNIISLLKQKRTIVYGIVKSNPNDVSGVTVDDMKKYYENHEQDYMTPEQVKISYVVINFTDVLKSIHPVEKDLINYYTQNESRYDQPEQWQVNVITVDSPDSAAAVSEQVAKAVKQKSGLSSLSGADVAQQAIWLKVGNIGADVKAALEKTIPGATTNAFRVSPNHYVVYQLLQHQSAVNKQYYEVKSSVKHAYINDQANKKWAQMLEDMADLSYEHPDTLNPLAQHFDVKMHATDFFPQNYDGGRGIQSNAEVVAAAFSDDVLAAGNNSDVIKLNHGKTALVLRVADSIQAHEKTFEEVSNAIKSSIIKERAMQRAKQSAEKIKLALEGGMSLEKIQQDFGIIFTKVSIGRFSQSVPDEILQQAFVLPVKKANIAKIKDADFSVVQLLSVTPGNASVVSEKDKAMYNSVIVNEWAQAELLSYAQSIVANTKVKIHNDALTSNS